MERSRTSRRLISSCNQHPNFLNPTQGKTSLRQLLPPKLYRQLVGKSTLTCFSVLNLKELVPCDSFEFEYQMMKKAAQTQMSGRQETTEFSQKKLQNFRGLNKIFGSETKQELPQSRTNLEAKDLLMEQQFLQLLNQLIYTGRVEGQAQIADNLMLQS